MITTCGRSSRRPSQTIGATTGIKDISQEGVLGTEKKWVGLINENVSRDRSGNQLRVRPHWAKEFPRSVGGVAINDYMRQIYDNQLPAYVQGMRRLVEEKNDGELSSTLAMFNTKYMENILNGYL